MELVECSCGGNESLGGRDSGKMKGQGEGEGNVFSKGKSVTRERDELRKLSHN